VPHNVEDTEKHAVGPEGDERWELVQRIVSSSALARSPQLRAFLCFVTKQAILGRVDEIKEQTIGSQVLGRRPDYDPAEDNIVRVRARQLRQKLQQYFSAEGQGEMLVVSMPTGGYIPVFERRILAPPVVISEATRNLAIHTRRPAWLPWALSGVLAALSLLLWLRSPPMHSRAQRATVPQSLEQFWSQIFSRNGDDVLLVLGDSGFALWQDLNRRNLTLADYLSAEFRAHDARNDSDISEVAARRYTSLADVNFVTRLLPLSQSLGSRVKVRFARNVDIRDLKNGNVILLGSRRANPWVEIFEPRLHYAYDYDVNARRSFFRNVSPRRGEAATFARNNNGASKGESYGVVALLPNMNGSGKVLLIEGLNMEGTDAAGELLLNPHSCEILIDHLRQEVGFPGQFFENLVKLTPLAGSSANVQLISVRRPSL
jgi:hypothetical protein